MKNEILEDLVRSGFTKDDDGVITSIYDRKYKVTLEDKGIKIWQSFKAETKDMKNAHLDAVESISGRYGITSAGYEGNNLYVILTPPSLDKIEEVRRVKFLIQSLNRITDKEVLKEEKKLLENTIKSENEKNILKKSEVSSDNNEIYRATARKGSAIYGAYGYTKDKDGNKRKDTYISNETSSYENTRKIIETKKEPESVLMPLDREEIPTLRGTLGAILGVMVSLLLLGIIHKVGLLASLFAFIMGIMAYIGYRSLSKENEIKFSNVIIPIIIGCVFLSAVMNAIEIQEIIKARDNIDLSLGAALGRGFVAFINNRVYDVPKSFEQIGVAFISALLGLFGSLYFMDHMDKIIASFKKKNEEEDY